MCMACIYVCVGIHEFLFPEFLFPRILLNADSVYLSDQHPGDVTSDDVVTLYRDVNKYALVHYCSVFVVLIASTGLHNNL